MKLRLPWQRKADSSMDVLRDFLASASSKTGIPVNWKTALEATTSLACARVIAEGLAQVPCKVYREKDGGGRDADRMHPLYGVLHDTPNEWQTSYEWREMTGLHLVFAGCAYSYINRVRGEVVELIPFDPGSVTVRRKGYAVEYKVKTEEGKDQYIHASSMLHLKGPSWNSWQGLDGVRLAREAIGLSLAAEEHATRFFSNGARVGGVLSTDQSLTKDQVDSLRVSWESAQGGLANAYKTAVLFGGMKFIPTATPNDNAQMVELRNQQVEEICRSMRVMPIMVGYSDKTSTYASAEQMFLAHVVHTMGPWYARLEQAFNKWLLTPEDRRKGYYTKFIVAGLLRGAHKDRAEYYRVMKDIGALNPNEIRALDELGNPYEGGDTYTQALNTAPVGANSSQDKIDDQPQE